MKEIKIVWITVRFDSVLRLRLVRKLWLYLTIVVAFRWLSSLTAFTPCQQKRMNGKIALFQHRLKLKGFLIFVYMIKNMSFVFKYCQIQVALLPLFLFAAL